MEEYLAKTDPNNSKSIPALIDKLMYVKDDSLVWVLRPGPADGAKFSFKYEDSARRATKTSAEEMVGPNGLFFAKVQPGMMKDRFKLLGHEVRKEMSKSTKVEMEVTFVRIEDQRPNKKGTGLRDPGAVAGGAQKRARAI